MREHVDDRRHLYADIFPTTEGDVNLIRLFDGALSAWHRHQKQTDYFFCVSGRVRFGLCDGVGNGEWLVLDEGNGLQISPDTWHGYWAFSGDATLLMWATQKYNPDDEERKSVEEMGIPWTRVPR